EQTGKLAQLQAGDEREDDGQGKVFAEEAAVMGSGIDLAIDIHAARDGRADQPADATDEREEAGGIAWRERAGFGWPGPERKKGLEQSKKKGRAEEQWAKVRRQ